MTKDGCTVSDKQTVGSAVAPEVFINCVNNNVEPTDVLFVNLRQEGAKTCINLSSFRQERCDISNTSYADKSCLAPAEDDEDED